MVRAGATLGVGTGAGGVAVGTGGIVPVITVGAGTTVAVGAGATVGVAAGTTVAVGVEDAGGIAAIGVGVGVEVGVCSDPEHAVARTASTTSTDENAQTLFMTSPFAVGEHQVSFHRPTRRGPHSWWGRVLETAANRYSSRLQLPNILQVFRARRQVEIINGKVNDVSCPQPAVVHQG